MRRQGLFILAMAVVLSSLAGCNEAQMQPYTYQYRAGTWYEYEKLLKAWIPNNGTPPPLKPTSQQSVGQWVQVPSSGPVDQPQRSEDSYSQTNIYIGGGYYDDGFYLHHGYGYWPGWYIGRPYWRGYYRRWYTRPYYRGCWGRF